LIEKKSVPTILRDLNDIYSRLKHLHSNPETSLKVLACYEVFLGSWIVKYSFEVKDSFHASNPQRYIIHRANIHVFGFWSKSL